MADDLYYIQDTRQVVGNSAVWWREHGSGYTCDLNEAWKVSFEIASCYRKTDVPRRCTVIDRISERHCDVQKLREMPEGPR